MDIQKSIDRLNLLRGHINLSDRAKAEQGLTTFDVDKARKDLWKHLPEGWFEVFECLSEIRTP